MDSVKCYENHLVLRHKQGHFYFVWVLLFCDNLQTLLGLLLLGRALLIGTLLYFNCCADISFPWVTTLKIYFEYWIPSQYKDAILRVHT